MSHYKPYPAYKDSGVEWIGEVPEHWVRLPLKRLAVICNGQDYKNVADSTGEIPVMGSGGEFARASRPLFDGESVLLGRKGTIDRLLYMKGPFWPVDTMFYTLINEEADGRFVYYAALNIPFDRYSTNTALPSMTQEDPSSHMLAAPRKHEQSAIASALDRETARIDALIAKKTRFIELLKEKRQALITHAVTKGLDPSVTMKDSGVAWIGEVPEHWDAVQLRRAVRAIEQGWSPECLPWNASEREWGVLKAGCVNGGVYRETENKALPPGIQPRPELEVAAGDVLVSRASGTPEFVGSAAHVRETRTMLMLSDKVFRIRFLSSLDAQFFVVVMGSRPTRFQIENSLSGGNGLANNLPQSTLMDFIIPLPPSVEEQRAIVAHLDQRVALIDALTSKAEQSIALLKGRRSALITAAVTGQIDLREEAA